MVRFQGAGGRKASAWMFPALWEAPLLDVHAGVAARLRLGTSQVVPAARARLARTKARTGACVGRRATPMAGGAQSCAPNALRFGRRWRRGYGRSGSPQRSSSTCHVGASAQGGARRCSARRPEDDVEIDASDDDSAPDFRGGAADAHISILAVQEDRWAPAALRGWATCAGDSGIKDGRANVRVGGSVPRVRPWVGSEGGGRRARRRDHQRLPLRRGGPAARQLADVRRRAAVGR